MSSEAPARRYCLRHDADHRQRDARRLLRPACAASASSPSTPSSCATAPTTPSSAWCRWRGEEEAVAIDPLAPGLDLAPAARAAWPTSAVLKVMHAARQDLEIFYHLGQLPRAVLRHPGRGHGLRLRRGGRLRHAGEQARRRPARQELALHRLGAPAAVRGADPLRAGRRHPPAGDLPSSSPPGSSRRGRMAWVAEELAGPARPRALRASRPRRPGGGSSCARATRRFIAIVQALAAWREREAQRRDLPRARIIRDDLLMEVAANRPQIGRGAARPGAGQPRPRERRRRRRRHPRRHGPAQGPAAPPCPSRSCCRAASAPPSTSCACC